MQISEPGRPQYGDGDTSYQAAGGIDGIRRLVDAFYDQMETLPQAADIRAMHRQDLAESRDKLSCFLSGWLGGPKLYREKYGPISIPAAHAQLRIGSLGRDAWLLCMEKALEQQPWADDFKRYLLRALSVPAERCRTRD
ncbi:group II truncated hemoglobin [Marinobacterium rhizophilum]|uniref:Group II truncated hemoglobin n=1 Tax=Marinobacterium rhizophilum TaxID=420402 RepID=A0ABY5HNQ5_9GAMM|nr:group II truncated hemoglobin [Marinobacterium rhizophilum]UTW13749.1 group II truncated hemoglobin [Marinobacterium rhizophilum]